MRRLGFGTMRVSIVFEHTIISWTRCTMSYCNANELLQLKWATRKMSYYKKKWTTAMKMSYHNGNELLQWKWGTSTKISYKNNELQEKWVITGKNVLLQQKWSVATKMIHYNDNELLQQKLNFAAKMKKKMTYHHKNSSLQQR